APISALLTGGFGVPEEFGEYRDWLGRANREAVLADWEAWHRVLPVEGAGDVLDFPVAGFRRVAQTNPSDLLRPEYGVVPYLFRDEALQEGVRWCRSGEPMALASITATGGAGKTRYALELCRTMRDLGWVAGLRPPDGLERVAQVPLPRLVVIDYLEEGDLTLLERE